MNETRRACFEASAETYPTCLPTNTITYKDVSEVIKTYSSQYNRARLMEDLGYGKQAKITWGPQNS